jgi:hypothetical protein
MFEQTDDRLTEWISNVLGPVPVSLAPPGSAQEDSGVSLYLYEVIDSPPPRGTRRSPLQILLRYLITTWAKEPREAHRLLGKLIFAALDDQDMQVDLTPLPAAAWRALGTVPQPGFMLRVPVRQERPEPPTHLVRVPLVVEVQPTTGLWGTLVGPENVPLVGASVELTSLQRTVRTDSHGRFAFANVPASSQPQQLCVRVKGREFVVQVDEPASEEHPLVIQFDPENGRE